MACIFISANSFAGNYTWTGTTNSSWSTSTNWSPNGVPGSSDSIIINSTSTNLVLSAKQKVKRLTINGDTLDLGGDTLEITGSAAFSGGRINNGVCYPQCTGLLNFNSTIFGAEVKAKGQIKLNGCTFNNTAYFEHVGSAAGTGTGGNTFNGTTTLKNIGTSAFRIGGNYNDTFNGDAYLISVSNNVQISYGAHTYFNGNVEFTSSSIYGFNVGGPGNGNTYLASGKTITSGGSGIVGTFILRNFIQYGTTAQSFTSSGSLNMTGCVFNGDLTCSAQALLLSGNEFHGTSSFTKTGTSSDFSAGGNHFYSNVTFTNNATNTAAIRLASSTGDTFDGDATFNTNTGQFQIAYSDTSDFKGNISSNNSAKVTFGTAGGYAHFNGVNEQIVYGTGEYVISRMIVDKASTTLTLQKPIKIDTLLVLQNGIIKGDSINKVTVGVAGSITGMSPQNYIEAAILKIGNTPFTFPVGANGEYRPVTMGTPASLTDKFEAQYYKLPQTLSSNLDTGLNYISTCNYWRFERVYGTSNVSLTTNWYDHSCDVFDVDSTKLVGYQSGVWKNLGLLSYTGNDSLGSVTYSGSINGYKYYTLGHKLFPVVDFQISIDSTVNPALITFVNISRGFPAETAFSWIYDSSATVLDSLVFQNRKPLIREYTKNGYYRPMLGAFHDGVYYLQKKWLNLLNPTYIAVNYTLVGSRPANMPLGDLVICSCYDEVHLRYTISNLVGQLTITQDPTYLNTITPTLTNIFSATASLNILSNGEYLITATSNWSGTFDLVFKVNNCDVLNFSSSIMAGGILGSVFNPLINFSSPNSNISCYQVNSNDFEYEVNNIHKPKIAPVNFDVRPVGQTTPGTTSNYSLNQILERTYEIANINSGIAPVFTLELPIVEDDIEITRIEIVDRNNTPGSNIVIFDGGTTDPIKTNERVKLIFANNDLYPTISDPDLQTGTITNLPTSGAYSGDLYAKVNLSSCIAISSPCQNNFIEGLWNLPLVSPNCTANSILVRETIRITHIDNCEPGNPSNENNEYKTSVNCDATINACTNGDALVSVTSSVDAKVSDIKISVSIDERVGNPLDFIPLDNGSLSPCPSNGSSSSINLSLKIKNETTVLTGHPNESGAIRLQSIRLGLNTDLLNFNTASIKLGGHSVNYSITPGNPVITILFDPTSNPMTSDPSIASFDQIRDRMNNDLPDISDRRFIYLYPGEYIHLTIENLEFEDCNFPGFYLNDPIHPTFYLVDDLLLGYQSLCDIEKNPEPDPNDIDDPAITHNTFQLDVLSKYTGVLSGSANPVDIGSPSSQNSQVSPQSNLLFKFTENFAPGSILPPAFPWKVGSNFSTLQDLIDHPDLSYTFYLTLPTTLYFINSITFKDKTGAVIGVVPNSQITINNLATEVTVPFGTLIPFPDWDVEVDLGIRCDVSSAIDDFHAEYRAYANNGCPPRAYIVYGTDDLSLQRHCNGNCPENNWVATTNFNLDRTTLGWADKLSYDQDAGYDDPNVSQLIARLDRVYPCDMVKILSTEGSSYTEIGPNNYSGIPTILNLYFNVLIPDDVFQWNSNQPFTNIFENPGQGLHRFRITPDGVTPAQTIDIDIDFLTDIQAIPSPSWKPGYHLYQFHLDNSFPVSGLGTGITTILDVLRNYKCELEFECDVRMAELNISPDRYEMDLVIGEFSFDYNDNGVTTHVESCDPYADNLTYLKVQPVFKKTNLVGVNSDEVAMTDCQILFQYEVDIEGGYNNIDDFPNEFRPLLLIPDVINLSHSADVSAHSAELINQSTNSILSNYNISNTTPTSSTLTAISYTPQLAIDKDGNDDLEFNLILNRNCPNTIPCTTPQGCLLNASDLNNVWNLACVTTYTPINENKFNDFTTPEPNLCDRLSVNFITQSPFNASRYPAEIEFTVSYNNTVNSNSKLPLGWLYLTDNADPTAILKYRLEEFVGGSYTLIPGIASTGNPELFEINDVLNSNTNASNVRRFRLTLRWDNCAVTSSSGADDFEIVFHAGAYCNSNTYPNDVSLIFTNTTCSTCSTSTFFINQPQANLTGTLIGPSLSSIQDCETEHYRYTLQSTSGDVKTAKCTLTVTQVPNCTWAVNTIATINTSTGSLSYPLTNLATTGLNANGQYFEWDVISFLSNLFSPNDPHFMNGLVGDEVLSIDFDFDLQLTSTLNPLPAINNFITINVNMDAEYSNFCNESTILSSAGNSFDYKGTPAPSASIQQVGIYCGPTSSVQLNVIPSNTSYNYLWSSGATTSSITMVPNLFNYTVTVTFSSTCSSVISHQVIDEAITAPSFTLNPVGFCNYSNPVAITFFSSLSNNYLYSYGATTSPDPITINFSTYVSPINILVTNAAQTCSLNVPVTIPNTTPVFVGGSVNICSGSSTLIGPSGLIGVNPVYHWSNGSTSQQINSNSLNVSGTSVYTLTITSSDGCSNSQQYQVTNNSPTAQIGTNNIPGFCLGQPFTALSTAIQPAGSIWTYQWLVNGSIVGGNSPSVTFLPSVDPIVLDLTIIDNTTSVPCTSSTSITLHNLSPEVTINGGEVEDYICHGSDIMLVANVSPQQGNGIVYNYLWSNGSTNPSISVSSPGVYSVTVTSNIAGSCSSSDDIIISELDPNVQFSTTAYQFSAPTSLPLAPNNFTCIACSLNWADLLNPSLSTNASYTTPILNSSNTYTFSAINYNPNVPTLYGAATCSSLVSITVIIDGVDHCSYPSPTQFVRIDQNFIDAFNPPPSPSPSWVTLSGTHYYVSSDIKLYKYNLELTGTNVEIAFAPGVKFEITDGMEFKITEGAHLYPCSNIMWRGIYLHNGAGVTFKATSSAHPILIEGAEYAIEAESEPGSQTHIVFEGGYLTFMDNYRSLFLHDGDFSSSVFGTTEYRCDNILLAPHTADIFTQYHVYASNAGTLNFVGELGGSFGNRFNNARVDIETRKTNLKVMNCYFSNQRLSGFADDDFAIRFIGNREILNIPIPAFKLTVGDFFSPSISNSIENCKLGIVSHGRAEIKIVDNNLKLGRIGIRIWNNRTTFPGMANYDGSNYVSHNRIDGFVNTGIDLQNNGFIHNNIEYNEINHQIATVSETKYGIRVHNAPIYLNSMDKFKIRVNTIVDCQQGILVENQDGISVNDNDIQTFVLDNLLLLPVNSTSTFSRNGIYFTGSRNALIQNNLVSRPLDNNHTLDIGMYLNPVSYPVATSLAGIKISDSEDILVKSNTLSNLPTGFDLYNSNDGNQFICNEINTGLQGFKLTNIVMSDQGTASDPSGDSWVNWGLLTSGPRVTGYKALAGQPISWHYFNSVNTDFEPSFNQINPPFPTFITTFPQSNNPECGYCPDCWIDRLLQTLEMTNSQLLDEVLHYSLENHVYSVLNDSLQNVYSGTTYDATLQNFFTSRALQNVGIFESIDEMLQNGDFAMASIFQSEIDVTRLLDQNLVAINDLCIRYENDFEELDSTDKSIAEQIAYQYPEIGGLAVYRARAIVGEDLDYSQIMYRATIQSDNDEKAALSIYPNPFSNELEIDYLSREVQINEVRIVNLYGVEVFIKHNVNSNHLKLNLDSYQDGIYYVISKLSDESSMINKVIKIK